MCERTPRTRHPPDNADPPAVLQSVKRFFFFFFFIRDGLVATRPKKATFTVIKVETYGNEWTWP